MGKSATSDASEASCPLTEGPALNEAVTVQPGDL